MSAIENTAIHSSRHDIIGDKDPAREDWHDLALAWGVNSDYHIRDIAPEGVRCTACWDWNVCGECLGEYPDTCPDGCEDGTCPSCGTTGKMTN